MISRENFTNLVKRINKIDCFTSRTLFITQWQIRETQYYMILNRLYDKFTFFHNTQPISLSDIIENSFNENISEKSIDELIYNMEFLMNPLDI